MSRASSLPQPIQDKGRPSYFIRLTQANPSGGRVPPFDVRNKKAARFAAGRLEVFSA